ncbi:MAG: hypothetical protein ACK50H_07210, partial [Dolichospermum sp.]
AHCNTCRSMPAPQDTDIFKNQTHYSRLALKIVVMTREQGTGNREQGTGNREQGRGFRQLYFLLLVSVFSVHLLTLTN